MLVTVGLFLVGFVAGALNAAGGGGTFVALPALVAAGLPPVVANASTTVALLPGALASAWTFRGQLVRVGPTSTTAADNRERAWWHPRRRAATAPAVEGVQRSRTVAAGVRHLVLAFGRTLSRLLTKSIGHPVNQSARTVLIGQIVLGVYSGYFGGAVGIMMLAFWSVGLGMDPRRREPDPGHPAHGHLRRRGIVLPDRIGRPPPPIPVGSMLAGATAGGFAGARIARRLSTRALRGVVLTTAITMTVLYFTRG
ncbi:TSUP family transporter [Amycolatopsis sp. lyj-109]|uniref:TSUP family transporter n=1 Tax=Amycolatopsis sp. lyj-109 TaxID=2789287 RepID=UPI00397AB386